MSRTKKDRPYRIILRDRTAHPSAPRSERHDHTRLGEPYFYDKRTFDEVEQKWVVTERVLQGHFADHCTIDEDQRDLPPGVLATCWRVASFSTGQKPGWERSEMRERKRKLRGRSRREAQQNTKLADSGEDVGDDTLSLRRRELYTYD